MLAAPDSALRPAGDGEPTFEIEGHAVGVARGVHQRRLLYAGYPLVDRVADDIDPEEALAPMVPDRTFAEQSALGDLVEWRIGADDAFEFRRRRVEIHQRAPSLAGRTGAPRCRLEWRFFLRRSASWSRIYGRLDAVPTESDGRCR